MFIGEIRGDCRFLTEGFGFNIQYMMNKQNNNIAVVLRFDMLWCGSTSFNKVSFLAAIVAKQASLDIKLYNICPKPTQ